MFKSKYFHDTLIFAGQSIVFALTVIVFTSVFLIGIYSVTVQANKFANARYSVTFNGETYTHLKRCGDNVFMNEAGKTYEFEGIYSVIEE